MTEQKFLPGRLEDVLNQCLEDGEKPAVLVIDMQKTNYDPAFNENQYPWQVIQRQQELLSYAKQEGLPVIVVELHFGSLEPHSTLPELSQLVKGYPYASLLKKPWYSSFEKTDLEISLRRKKISTLLLMGQKSYCCVLDTARDARSLGFQVITAPTVLIPFVDTPSYSKNCSLFYSKNCKFYDDKAPL